ncbi:MAG TPA: CsbD family protein [Terriglobales bacterium]|nr:CsbD family protein [Terriglobales bacterium]
MDKDEVKGKAKDVAGRVQRQVGEWTGDSEAQVKGTAKQAEGKVQNAWGKVKDAAKKDSESDQSEAERERQRDRAVNE